jgi:hypothetical protein
MRVAIDISDSVSLALVQHTPDGIEHVVGKCRASMWCSYSSQGEDLEVCWSEATDHISRVKAPELSQREYLERSATSTPDVRLAQNSLFLCKTHTMLCLG